MRFHEPGAAGVVLARRTAVTSVRVAADVAVCVSEVHPTFAAGRAWQDPDAGAVRGEDPRIARTALPCHAALADLAKHLPRPLRVEAVDDGRIRLVVDFPEPACQLIARDRVVILADDVDVAVDLHRRDHAVAAGAVIVQRRGPRSSGVFNQCSACLRDDHPHIVARLVAPSVRSGGGRRRSQPQLSVGDPSGRCKGSNCGGCRRDRNNTPNSEAVCVVSVPGVGVRLPAAAIPGNSGSVPDMTVTVVEGDLPSDAAVALRAAGRIAVDTETSGLDWSRDRLQLCQLFSRDTGPILIRNVTSTPAELQRLLTDPGVVKVFHYAPFDLRFLAAQWGLHVASVECTKAASRLLEPRLPSPEHSLQPLLARYLGIKITKGTVRTSDWGAATLSEEQIAYAIGDVRYLVDLGELLTKRLADRGMTQLFEQVCAYMPVDAHLAVTGVPNPLAY